MPAYNEFDVHRVGFQHEKPIDALRVKGMMRVNDIDSFQFELLLHKYLQYSCTMHVPVSYF